MRIFSYYVYILANHKCGTLYTGVTNNLYRRITEHKKGIIRGFTCRYNVNQLVYFEETNDVTCALAREKQIKNWNRSWKIKLIEANNPEWKDLYSDLMAE
jgi:putative endonuclease